MKLITACLLLAVMVGCATKEHVFVKDGMTEADWKKDSGECVLMAKSSAAGQANPLIMVSMQQDILHQCMKVRGYEYILKDELWTWYELKDGKLCLRK